MNLISVVGLKGGSGRSTSAVVLSQTLPAALLVDLDGSTATASRWLGGGPSTGLELGQALQEGRSIAHLVENRILRAGPGLADAEEALGRDPLGIHHAAEALVSLRELPGAWALLDLGPRASTLTMAAVHAADAILIPVPLQPAAAEVLPATLRLVAGVEKALGGSRPLLVVGVMADGRGKLSAEVEEQLRAGLGKRMAKTTIPVSLAMARAEGAGELPPAGDRAMGAYEALAEELMQLMQRRQRRQ